MEQSFWQHVSELRRCLIRSGLALILGFVLSIFICRDLLLFLTEGAGQLVFLRPAELLMAQLKVAFVNGIFVSLPVILWQIGGFFWPALYPSERRALLFYLPFAFLLFATGMAFGFFIVVRIGYRFLVSLSLPQIQPAISIDHYLSFVITSILACAFIFMLPVILLLLTRIGVMKAAFLWRQQRSVIIGLLVLVAIITPTVDIISMLLVFFPLLLLFELSILLAWIAEKKAIRRDAKQDSA